MSLLPTAGQRPGLDLALAVAGLLCLKLVLYLTDPWTVGGGGLREPRQRKHQERSEFQTYALNTTMRAHSRLLA